MAIRVAATLRLADHIAAGRRSAATLAEATGSDADALGRLLAHLVTAGICDGDADGGYGLTDLGRQLCDDHPASGRRHLDANGAIGRADLSLTWLAETIRTAQPAYPMAYGRGFWEDLAADAALSASFDEQMGAEFTWAMPAILASYDWAGAAHIVDVGGGNGALLVGLLEACPALEGTLVVLASPAAAARRTLVEAGLDQRTRVVTASFFDPLPADGDVYVLSGVIHDWDDPDAVVILGRCGEAAGRDGRVVLLEGVRSNDEDEEGPGISTEMDLRMLAYVKGRERTRGELATIGERAGLTLMSVTEVDEFRSLIELVPESG